MCELTLLPIKLQRDKVLFDLLPSPVLAFWKAAAQVRFGWLEGAGEWSIYPISVRDAIRKNSPSHFFGVGGVGILFGLVYPVG